MEIFKKNSEDYSGNIKLRLPKSLHKELIEAAGTEGISLNQYCVYLLSEKVLPYMIGRKKLNAELQKIKVEVKRNDLMNLIEKLKPLIEKIEKLKPLIKDELSNKNKLTIQDENDLEFKYPILIDRDTINKFQVKLKVPTIKVVLEPINGYLKNEKEILDELDKELNKINSDKELALLTKINIDELNYNISPQLSREELGSLVIYFLSGNLNIVKTQIDTINSTLENSQYYNTYTVKYYPTYILEYM